MDDQLNKQTGKELLDKAIKQWEQDGFLDNYNDGKTFSKNRTDVDEENVVKHNLEKDPVINLFMSALAHQTNLLNEQVSSLRARLLDEFIRKTVPFTMTRPTPSMTVLRAKMVESSESFCMVDDSTKIGLEKRSKTKMRFKEQESFSFMPLLKTKILNATIGSVRRVDRNTYEVTLLGKSNAYNLSGTSLFFPNHSISSLSLSVNGKPIPVFSLQDYERLPLCDIFNVNHSVFNRSLLYGTTESWLDKLAPLANRLFYVGDFEAEELFSEMSFQIIINQIEEVVLSDLDVLLNCIPIVNVEKGSVNLSADEPIKKIATEKVVDVQEKKDSPITQSVKAGKSFLYLLAPSDQSYDAEQITLRRFAAERYHAGELVAQTRALVHRYSSDFHAFRPFADIEFDEKVNGVRVLLNEIEKIIDENPSAGNGVYVMLKKSSNGPFSGGQTRIVVSYLLTDAQRGIGIPSSCAVKLPPMFDEGGSAIMLTTFGGNDEVTDDETLRQMASYYHLTKDKLITKSDIKQFCYKELTSAYQLQKEAIRDVEFESDLLDGRPRMRIGIILSPMQNVEVYEELAPRVAAELQQKMNIRTTGFCTFEVYLKINA